MSLPVCVTCPHPSTRPPSTPGPQGSQQFCCLSGGLVLPKKKEKKQQKKKKKKKVFQNMDLFRLILSSLKASHPPTLTADVGGTPIRRVSRLAGDTWCTCQTPPVQAKAARNSVASARRWRRRSRPFPFPVGPQTESKRSCELFGGKGKTMRHFGCGRQPGNQT